MMVVTMSQTTTDQDDYDEYRQYNTGDQIWLMHDVPGGRVIQIQTHDGLFWTEGQKLVKLTGYRKYLHKLEMILFKIKRVF